MLKTQTPGQILLTLTDQDPVQTRQGFAIGFATTRVTLQKNIGQRINPADQFILNITGNPTDQVATTGAANGIQAQFAQVYASPGNTFSLNEGMAFGSPSYTLTVSASNATPAGSVPPITSLPIQFTTALGDDVTYTFLNAAPQLFTKTVDKAYADVGEILTYTVTVDNPNNFAVNNVLVTDSVPTSTSYVGNLTVSAPYTGTDPQSGITPHHYHPSLRLCHPILAGSGKHSAAHLQPDSQLCKYHCTRWRLWHNQRGDDSGQHRLCFGAENRRQGICSYRRCAHLHTEP